MSQPNGLMEHDLELVHYLLGLLPEKEADRLDEASIVDDDNVRVIQLSGRSRFLLESPHPRAVARKRQWQRFDRNVSAESNVARAIHLAHASATQSGQDAVVTHLPADPGVRLLDGHRPPDCFHGRSVDRRVTHRFIGEKGFDLPLQGSVTLTRCGQKRGAFAGWQLQRIPKQPADPLIVFRGHERRLH